MYEWPDNHDGGLVALRVGLPVHSTLLRWADLEVRILAIRYGLKD